MKTMKSVRLVLAVAGVLMAGGFAGAQGPGGPGMGPGFGEHRPPMERAFGPMGGHGQWWNNPNIVKQLTLTDDQRKAMDGIMQDHRMKLIDLQANLEKAEVTMGPLMKADAPNQSAIEAQIDKVVAGAGRPGKSECAFSAGPSHAVEAGPVEAAADSAPESHAAWRDAWRDACMGGRDGHDGHDGQRPGMGGPGSQFRGGGGQFQRRQGPPPQGGAAPQGGPAPQGAPAPAPGSQPQGTGEQQ